MSYPIQSLFFSDAWKNHAKATGVAFNDVGFEAFKGLKLAKRIEGEIADYELLPTTEEVSGLTSKLKSAGVDWFVARKLTNEMIDGVKIGGYVTEYSKAPWLDLQKPINVKKEVASHIGRTERKITREIGALHLRAATNEDKNNWFKIWREFEEPTGRFTIEKFELYSKWLLTGVLPEWVKLMTLEVESKDGMIPLALGIFYVFDGVFYYYAPVMNPSAELRKYGAGKLMVQKLIDYAKAAGCHTFDFLQGEHEYKFHWNPEVRQLFQVIYPMSFKGKIALLFFKFKKMGKKK